MRVSRDQMAENRRRILEVASRLFRDKGFDAVSVAEVMKAAGLTHGGFYGHFSSKDDLIAQTLAHVLAADAGEGGNLRTYLDDYLHPGIATTAPAVARRRASPRRSAFRPRLHAQP